MNVWLLQNTAYKNANDNNIWFLSKIYECNKETFESVRKGMKINELTYHQIKGIDMRFWQIGYKQDTKNWYIEVYKRIIFVSLSV